MELLISTPVTPMEVMLGKLLPYFGIGLLDAGLCIALALFWFHVPFRGTFFTLFVTTALFLVVVLGIGYLISVSIRSQLGASRDRAPSHDAAYDFTLRLHLSHRPNAQAYSGDHLSGACPLLRHHSQRGISQRSRLDTTDYADPGSNALCHGDRFLRRAGIPQDTGVKMFGRIWQIFIKEMIEMRRDKWARFRIIVPSVIQIWSSAMLRPSKFIMYPPLFSTWIILRKADNCWRILVRAVAFHCRVCPKSGGCDPSYR